MDYNTTQYNTTRTLLEDKIASIDAMIKNRRLGEPGFPWWYSILAYYSHAIAYCIFATTFRIHRYYQINI